MFFRVSGRFYRRGRPLSCPAPTRQGALRWHEKRSSSAARCRSPPRPTRRGSTAWRNPHPDTDYVARFTAPEFTTLCPITGQPDFAHLVIDYVPGNGWWSRNR
jgi:NADPH-dependent 7-cyano-7-deazaguanine reductase QueF